MNLRHFNILITFFTVFTATGQQSLTAKQAVFTALENNYQILIVNKQVDINERNNKWSEAGLFPTIDLTLGQNNFIQDNTKNPLTFTPGLILSQGLNPSLGANWNIFTGFSVRMSKQRLEQLEKQSSNNAMAVIETTIQDVLKAYYTAQLQKERLDFFKSVLELSGKRYRYYEIREKYSTSSSLASLQFKNQYLTDSTNYLMQQISYENSLRNLKLLMNDTSSVEADFLLTDALSFETDSIDFESARTEMLSNNANLKNQYIALQLQETATGLQRSFLYPTLSFQTGIQPGWSRIQDLNNSDFQISTTQLSYYGNFNLRYSIFNNWKNKRAVEVSKIQEEIATLNIQAMEQSLTTTLKNLIDLHEMRTRLVRLSQENLEYAKRAFELAERRFSNGSINSIDLSNFQSSYQNTMVQYYEHLYNKLDTYLEIYKMTGKIGLEYQKE